MSVVDYKNIDEPLARIAADGAVRYYHADALGSIIALTDENGNVTARYNYSPFGVTEIVQDTDGSGAANPFRYTGREHDETGLYYYRARYYSPEMGRFLSEDPIRFAGGDVNFYAYVRNRPLNLVDPLGLVDAVRSGTVTRVNWQNPNDHNYGLGWRITISTPTGSYDQYGHMDPSTTPAINTAIKAGDYIGEYADPTNGLSSGPHVHYERRDANGNIINPGNVLPIPNGQVTTPYGQTDTMHPYPHGGIDCVNP